MNSPDAHEASVCLPRRKGNQNYFAPSTTQPSQQSIRTQLKGHHRWLVTGAKNQIDQSHKDIVQGVASKTSAPGRCSNLHWLFDNVSLQAVLSTAVEFDFSV